MKTLRLVYMVLAWIIFLPIAVVIELVWFGVLISATKYVGTSIVTAVKVWWNHLVSGIKMNIDFINNGL